MSLKIINGLPKAISNESTDAVVVAVDSIELILRLSQLLFFESFEIELREAISERVEADLTLFSNFEDTECLAFGTELLLFL